MKKKKSVKYLQVHPGEILQDAINEAGLNQSSLAQHIGVSQTKINDICRGRRGISLEMAARLGKAFGTSTELWYNLQKQFELDSFDESAFKDIKRASILSMKGKLKIDFDVDRDRERRRF